MDYLEHEDDLEREQAGIDDYDDRVGSAGRACEKGTNGPTMKGCTQVLGALIEAELQKVSIAVKAMAPGNDLDQCFREQHEEQIGSLKSDLTDVSHNNPRQ